MALDLCEDCEEMRFMRDSIRMLGRVGHDKLELQHLIFSPNADDDEGVCLQTRPTRAELEEAFVVCDMSAQPDSSSVTLRIAVSRCIMTQHDYDHAVYLGAAASSSCGAEGQRTAKRARGRVSGMRDDFHVVHIPTDVCTDTLFIRGLFAAAASGNSNPFCAPISRDLLPA